MITEAEKFKIYSQQAGGPGETVLQFQFKPDCLRTRKTRGVDSSLSPRSENWKSKLC